MALPDYPKDRKQTLLMIWAGADLTAPAKPARDREEGYLYYLSGVDTETALPALPCRDRREMYMAYKAGQTDTLPALPARDSTEQYWEVICGRSETLPDIPRDSTQQILEVIAENSAAPTEDITVVGVSPLVLEDAVSAKLISLTQYGKIVQNGTPDPSLPVDIVCNNGVLRMVDDELPAGYTRLKYIHLDGASYFDSGIVPKTFDYDIETVCAFSTTVGGPNSMWGYLGSQTSLPRWQLSTYTGGILLCVNTTSAISNIADTNVHTFKGVVKTDGGTPVWQSYIDGEQKQSANLTSTASFEGNTLPIFIGARNNNGTPGNFAAGDFYGHTVTKAGVAIQNLISARRDADGEVGIYDLVGGVFLTNQGTGTVTAGPADYSHAHLEAVGTLEVISVGEHTASAVNLYAVGDYADTQEIISGAVTRKVGIKVFDGTEDWSTGGSSVTYFYNTMDDINATAEDELMCSHFGVAPRNTLVADKCCIRSNRNGILFSVATGSMTITTWKDFLSAQYAAGTPVIVLYPLAESVEESAAPQTLPLAEGDNTLTVIANVDDIDLEVTYRKQVTA